MIGKQIDIVALVQRFAMVTLLVKDDTDSPKKRRKRELNDDGDTLVSNLVRLQKHIKFCTRNFSTYFMLG